MHVNLNIPKPIEEALRRELGDNLEPATREALAVEAYRRGKLSLGEFAEMLNVTTDEADGLLKERGVYLDVTLPEIRDDVASLRGLVGR
jgi:predicted HTH domain antitoxin